MSRKLNPVVISRSQDSSQKHGIAVRATCLLCRVLWPSVVPHRHLPFDYSSEAKTLLLTQSRP